MTKEDGTGKLSKTSVDEQIAQGIILALYNYYTTLKRKFPNRREIFYLALTWAMYAKKHHPTQYQNDNLSFLTITCGLPESLVFSKLEYPKSLQALSFYMIYKERLSVSDKYEVRFNALILEINFPTAEHAASELKQLQPYIMAELETLGKFSENNV